MRRTFAISPFFALAVFLATSTAPAAEARPNFVVILADDQAWNGTAVPMIAGDETSRSPNFRTPNLARLAAEGVTFSQAYASHCKCECSRAALLMGRSTTSLNATDKRDRQWNAPPSASLANTLKRAAPEYRAAHLGKWQWPQAPASMGYDVNDGITQNEDGDSPDPKDPKRSFSITRQAVLFMKEQAAQGRPFYLQLSYYAVHATPQALASTLQNYEVMGQGGATPKKKADAKKKAGAGGGDRRVITAMTEDLDGRVGVVLEQLEALGIAKDTYVIYTSDNGGRTGVLSGGKGNLGEGGIRVPLIVRGPGVVAGRHCNEPVVGYDLLATVLDLAAPGTDLPLGVEGGSWRAVLADPAAKVRRPLHRLVFHMAVEVEHPQSAIRRDDFKLLYEWDTRQARLYDLAEDPGERKDLAKLMPEKAAALREELRQHVRAGLGEKAFAALDGGSAPIPGR